MMSLIVETGGGATRVGGAAISVTGDVVCREQAHDDSEPRRSVYTGGAGLKWFRHSCHGSCV
jgi:hypothetical protein